MKILSWGALTAMSSNLTLKFENAVKFTKSYSMLTVYNEPKGRVEGRGRVENSNFYKKPFLVTT